LRTKNTPRKIRSFAGLLFQSTLGNLMEYDMRKYPRELIDIGMGYQFLSAHPDTSFFKDVQFCL